MLRWTLRAGLFGITKHTYRHKWIIIWKWNPILGCFSHWRLERIRPHVTAPIHAGGKIVSFDYKVRDAALDRSYMLIYMLSEWFMQIMHIIPKGIPPQTARINCRKLAIKSVVLGAKGEGHWESKDIQLLEPSRTWWWRKNHASPSTERTTFCFLFAIKSVFLS